MQIAEDLEYLKERFLDALQASRVVAKYIRQIALDFLAWWFHFMERSQSFFKFFNHRWNVWICYVSQ